MPYDNFEEYCRLFRKAEKHLKATEQFTHEVCIPAIVELRHAGHHCTKALMSQEPDEERKQINEAIGHCERAIHDANDTGLISCFDQIESFKRDHPKTPILPAIPKFNDHLVRVREIQRSLLELTPHAGDGPWDQTAEYFEELQSICYSLDEGREDLRKNAARWRLILLTTLISIAIGLIGSAVAIFNVASTDSTASQDDSPAETRQELQQ